MRINRFWTYIKIYYGISFLLLLIWGIWAALPYLEYLVIGGERYEAVRNAEAGYEFPVFIFVCMVLVAIGTAAWVLLKGEIKKPRTDADSGCKDVVIETANENHQFPWFRESATPEQRADFEKELYRLCSACQKGTRGETSALADFLRQKISEDVILISGNDSSLHRELETHYGLGVSLQALNRAMNKK